MRVDELKNKILQLAIQGKLVPQDENDIPASVLLEEIKKEKEQLIKEKKIKREKPLPEITEEEKPFEIPKGWEWVRLGDIGSYKKGPFGSTITKSMFVPKSDNAIKVYEQKNAIQKNWTLGDYYVTKEYFEDKLKGFEVFEGDIIVSCAGTIGETYIMPPGIERGVINQALMKMNIFTGINIDYFLMYFESILKSTAKESSKGSAIKNIPPFDIFKKMLFAVPPVAEQQRIVQKVDELFSIIDELSKNKETMLKNISNTRNKVLQLAIQGKLVEQKPEDTPASVLLEEIRKEKETLIKEKKIKKEKALPEITEEEKPFEIPKGWEWVRFSQVLDVRDGTHDTPKYLEKGVPLITSKNINGKEVDFNNVKYISMEDHIEISKRSNVENGDILFAMIGSIGNPVIVNKKEEFSIKNVALFKFYKKNIVNNKFLYYYLLLAQNDMKSNSKGAVQSFVSLKILREYIFPLPSVVEQQRIVQKVDEIMAYLDELEKTII